MKYTKIVLFIFFISVAFIFGCKLFQSNDSDSEEYFPLLHIEANNYYDLGYAIGEGFFTQILTALDRQTDLIATIQSIIAIDSVYFYNNLVAAAEAQFPDYVQEIHGAADAIGVEHETLMTLNLFGDILALFYGAREQVCYEIPSAPFGCSTVSYNYNGMQYLAHNEDGFAQLGDLMGVVKAKIPGKPEFINFYYPGLLCGIAPALTDAGLAFSGNYIQSASGVLGGVPHLFIFRALLEAEDVDDAISIIQNTLTCNALHINIASDTENRVVSVEKADNITVVYEVEGLYAHTNHFIQDALLAYPTDDDATTHWRYDTLTGLIAPYEDNLEDVSCDVLRGFLCEVAAEPDTTGGLTGGMTLGSSIINMESGKWKLYFNDPNDNLYQILKF